MNSTLCAINNATAICALENYNTDLLNKCSHTEENPMMLAFRVAACATCLLSLTSAFFNYRERKELINIQATPTQSHGLAKVQLCLSIANFCTMGITLATMLSTTPFISLDDKSNLPAWLEYDWKTSLSSCTPKI